jgi:hypothetical protein
VTLCNYGSACSCTARYHSSRRAAAELCAAAQPTTRCTLTPHCRFASPHPDPCLPTANARAFFPYHPPATSHPSAAPLNAKRLVHSISIVPTAVSSN